MSGGHSLLIKEVRGQLEALGGSKAGNLAALLPRNAAILLHPLVDLVLGELGPEESFLAKLFQHFSIGKGRHAGDDKDNLSFMQARFWGLVCKDNMVPDRQRLIGDNWSVPKTKPDSQYYVDFRRRLKDLKDDLGYTQDQMAKALGMSKANYQKYEDRSKFPLHKLEQLALVTHQTLDFIVTGKNPRPALRLVRK